MPKRFLSKLTASLSNMIKSLEHEVAERRRTEEALQKSEEKYRLLYTNTPVMMHSIDRKGRLLSVSNFWLESLGYEQAEVIGQKSVKFLTAESQRYAQEVVLPEYFRTGICKDVPYQIVKKNGAIMDVLLSAIAEKDANGNVVRSLAVLIDVTQRKQAEEALRKAHEELELRVQERTAELLAANQALQSEITRRKQVESHLFEEKERAQVTLAAIGDAVITTDTKGQIESLNALAEQLTGWRASEARGLSLQQIFKIINKSTREPVQDPVQRCLRESRIVRLASHIILLRRDGREFAIDDSAAPIRNREGKLIGAVLIFRDVTEQRKLTEHISYQATHDVLTGLVNRHEFERRLNLMLEHAKENRQQHALCYLDLDQFKVVNDTCGHSAGDEMLRQLTALLKTRVRERDTLARLGGDEFGLLLGECPLDQALCIANALRESIQDFRFVWQDKLFTLGVSIGLVPITEESGDSTNLLSAADSACYVAKEKGRNRVNIYQSDNSDLAQRHGEMQWVSRLHRALAEGRFCLYYQPIVPIGQGVEDKDGEILLRLLDEQGVLVPPGAFIPPAERYHQMLAIDCWVIRTVFAMLRTRLSTTQPLVNYAINISGQSISDETFLDFVIKQLDQTGIPPEKICFEITETTAITNLTSAIRFISALRNRGCRFALDDFGSGLCSFAYLKNLSVDYLKIDGSFVRDIVNDPIDYAMVEAINRIGHVMGIKTIAESMENNAILEKLKIIGVDYVQGYGIAKPKRIDEVVGSKAL